MSSDSESDSEYVKMCARQLDGDMGKLGRPFIRERLTRDLVSRNNLKQVGSCAVIVPWGVPALFMMHDE